MNTLEERLVSERTRLNLSQAEFAQAAGVHKRSQINYEKGLRCPDTSYLQAIEKLGVDLLYLLTGRPSVPPINIETELKALSDAWEAVDWALAEAKKTLPPKKKRLAAEALYLAVKTGEGEAKPLARLMSKAA